MESNFDASLANVLVHEGGYVNHAKDPGGATNRGVTQRTYDAYRARTGQAVRDVRMLTDPELRAIYKGQYWDKVQGDELPSGLDYAVFDFAVNSGPSRAAKFLQEIVRVDADGVIGSQTLAALDGRDAGAIVVQLCDNRLAWLKRLKTFSTFGKGWTRRVNDVKDDALSMAFPKAAEPARLRQEAGTGKTGAEPKVKASAQAKDNADSLTAGGALTALITGSQVTDGAAQLLLVAGAVALVAFFVWMKWKDRA